jgi:hypothetical protein
MHISRTALLTARLCRYERSDIEEWFREHNTSPKTGQVLLSTTLVPNHQMRSRVLEWQVDDVFWILLLNCTIQSCSGAACGSQIILFDACELASDAFSACAEYSLFVTCYSASSSNLQCCRAAANHDAVVPSLASMPKSCKSCSIALRMCKIISGITKSINFPDAESKFTAARKMRSGAA